MNFNSPPSINFQGLIQDFSIPKIMGIINLTEDSFYSGNRFLNGDWRAQITKQVQEGVDFLDLGPQSTRPGAQLLSSTHEKKVLKPVLEFIASENISVPVSIDTFYADTAEFAIDNGAHLINDVSGGLMDSRMFKVIAKYNFPYVLMHMRGTPSTMKSLANYQNLRQEVIKELAVQVDLLQQNGASNIIVDPGFGFAKTAAHNFELLQHLNDFKLFNLPILAGVSRKSMIYKTLNIEAEGALNGTTALNMIALQKGANILRVHDVKAAQECIKLTAALTSK